jgi:nitrogen fixation protein NifU and related proteins
MNLYQDHILDHYHNPRHSGSLDCATHESDVRNPSCGDVLHFELKVTDGVLEKIAWTGQGCAISQASASLLSETIVGKNQEELLAKTPEEILKILEIPLSPGRLKCGILSLEALHAALLQEVRM